MLVRVRACGLNRDDTGMRRGHAHGAAGGAGTVLGMEWAGEVAELGPAAKGVKIGRPKLPAELRHEITRRAAKG